MNILQATIDDAAAIFDLQRCAYQTEAVIYDDFTIPPLVETLDELQDQFRFKQFLKAMQAERIVGSVRSLCKEETCYIERLIVHPDCRNRSIGTALLRQVEADHPAAGRFELFTGQKSVNNLRLYESLGYRPFREQIINEKLTMVFLEKVRL
ncbi:MAG: GNAT family N-acetyltransferase [Thermoguttaceae bacterium]